MKVEAAEGVPGLLRAAEAALGLDAGTGGMWYVDEEGDVFPVTPPPQIAPPRPPNRSHPHGCCSRPMWA